MLEIYYIYQLVKGDNSYLMRYRTCVSHYKTSTCEQMKHENIHMYCKTTKTIHVST